MLLAGPTSKRYFPASQAIEFPALGRLADRVAVSGAFPGAFPTLSVRAAIAQQPLPLSSQTPLVLDLQLTDGGVRDNLGLSLLDAADALAREAAQPPMSGAWSGFTPPSDWALDLMLASDGGKFFQSEATQGTLATIMRAVDLSGLETGVYRPLRHGLSPQQLLLSPAGIIAPSPDAAALGVLSTARRDAQHAYFRPANLAPEVLDLLVASLPDQRLARAAYEGYRSLPAGFSVNLTGLPQRCAASGAAGGPGGAQSDDCRWWRFVSLIGDDIWRSTEIFADTPTLSDTFTAEQAAAIYRFGQYMVLLKSTEIRAALARAVAGRQRGQQVEPASGR